MTAPSFGSILKARGADPAGTGEAIHGLDHHVASHAVWRAGATPCILPAKLPAREFAQLIQLAQSRVLIWRGEEALGGVKIAAIPTQSFRAVSKYSRTPPG